MSTVILGCDRNASNDSACQDAVAKAIEKAGNTVEKLGIGPNQFASYSYSNKAKGKIGVFLIASGITAIADLYDGNTQFKYAYFGIRGDLKQPRLSTMSDFNSSPISKDWHGDCISKSCNSLAGKTYPQMNEVTKSKCIAVFGETCEQLGENIVKAMGGEVQSSDNKQASSGSTAKESIQKLLTHWDGEVECFIRGDRVYINKIKEPESDYNLVLQEGVNIFTDSLQITDVNPNTVNLLKVKWTKGTITLKDEELIKRFGEIKSEVEAVKKVVKTETVTTTVDTSTDTGTDTGTDTTATDTATDAAAAATDTGTDTATDTESTTETTTTTKTTVVEEPITNYKEALQFANTEWNKIKRENGHTIECQVRGSNKWQVGKWVKVIIPSFNENCFMYITRVSQSDDGGDWNCNLSLADYPPGWGEEQIENTEETEDEAAEGEEATTDEEAATTE